MQVYLGTELLGMFSTEKKNICLLCLQLSDMYVLKAVNT